MENAVTQFHFTADRLTLHRIGSCARKLLQKYNKLNLITATVSGRELGLRSMESNISPGFDRTRATGKVQLLDAALRS
jgi:hypothetical protein